MRVKLYLIRHYNGTGKSTSQESVRVLVLSPPPPSQWIRILKFNWRSCVCVSLVVFCLFIYSFIFFWLNCQVFLVYSPFQKRSYVPALSLQDKKFWTKISIKSVKNQLNWAFCAKTYWLIELVSDWLIDRFVWDNEWKCG